MDEETWEQKMVPHDYEPDNAWMQALVEVWKSINSETAEVIGEGINDMQDAWEEDAYSISSELLNGMEAVYKNPSQENKTTLTNIINNTPRRTINQ